MAAAGPEVLARKEQIWREHPDDAHEILDASRSHEVECRQRGCAALMWWGYTPAGKRCPFDVAPDGTHTGTSHWRTCTDRPKRPHRQYRT